jgi:hypothetical protein
VHRDTPAPGGENVSVRPRSMSRRGLSVSAAALLTLGLAACGHDEPAPAPTTPAPSVADDATDARAGLAGLATLAQDHPYAALYSLDPGDGVTRNVVATSASDGTWRVDVSAGALGGTADVSIVSTKAGVYQCTVSSPQQPLTPTCVRVADPGKKVPADYDPQVERLFRPALNVFTDRQAPLSVAAVQPLAGAKGSCFSVDTIAAALSAPVDVGIYCYTADGLLTAARVDLGTLTLVNTGAGPATVTLPGPEVPGQPMTTASPSAPPPLIPSGPPSIPPAQ